MLRTVECKMLAVMVAIALIPIAGIVYALA